MVNINESEVIIATGNDADDYHKQCLVKEDSQKNTYYMILFLKVQNQAEVFKGVLRNRRGRNWDGT